MKKTLDLNNSKTLSALKEGLNKAIDKKISEQRITEKLNEMKNLSFGELKSLFESTLSRIYDTNEGKKLIASYAKIIKENKSLKSLYKIYEHTLKGVSVNPAASAYFVSDICNSLDKKELKEGEEKLYKIWVKTARLVECTIPEMDNILEENKSLNESISYLCNNKKSASNLNECIQHINTISESIKKVSNDNTEEINESKDNKELIDELHGVLAEGQYTTWENRVINDLAICSLSNGNREDLFESYKQDCISTIDEVETDDEEKNVRLAKMKQQLSEKKFNENTLIDDLFKLSELKETLLNA